MDVAGNNILLDLFLYHQHLQNTTENRSRSNGHLFLPGSCDCKTVRDQSRIFGSDTLICKNHEEVPCEARQIPRPGLQSTHSMISWLWQRWQWHRPPLGLLFGLRRLQESVTHKLSCDLRPHVVGLRGMCALLAPAEAGRSFTIIARILQRDGDGGTRVVVQSSDHCPAFNEVYGNSSPCSVDTINTTEWI